MFETLLATRRRRWLAAGLVLAVVVVVAMLFYARNRGGLEVGGAVEQTLAAGSAHLQIVTSADDLPLVGDAELVVAEGEVDFARQRTRLTREVPLLQGRQLLGGLAIEPIEIIATPEGTWIRAPLGLERPWVQAAEGTGAVSELDPTSGIGSPAVLLGVLRSLERPPRVLGTEEVGGVRSTRYEVLVDLDEVARLLPGSAGEWVVDLRRLRGSGDLPVEVWIGEEGYVRRIRFTVPVDLAGVASVTLRTDVELSEFGRPVQIAAPPPEQVADVSADQLRELNPLTLLRDLIERFPF